MRIDRRPALCTLIVLGAVLMAGCAGLTKGQADADVGMKERGIASWYGDDFDGWVTASGDIYDIYGLTAAHRTLPLGTMLRVTNVVNGRHVTIRVNDRGPYVNGRILDLSYAAARELDMVRDGISAVYLEVVGHHGPELSVGHLSGATDAVPLFDQLGQPWTVPPPDRDVRGPFDSVRVMPSDILRERRARRVGDILAAEHRADVVATLELA
jgi:peptidoglycan lytic transglycosylase